MRLAEPDRSELFVVADSAIAAWLGSLKPSQREGFFCMARIAVNTCGDPIAKAVRQIYEAWKH